MSISTISTKGQITLPVAVRRKLGLKPGDRVVVEATEGAVVVRPAPDLFKWKGFLPKTLRPEEERRLMEQAVGNDVVGREE